MKVSTTGTGFKCAVFSHNVLKVTWR